MRPGGGRKKGSRFELDIAKQIAKWCNFKYGTDIRRTPNSGALITRADIWVNPKVRNRFPFFVEMKNREKWNLEGLRNNKWPPFDWYKEAVGKLAFDPDYDPSSVVILIFKHNGIDPLVMVESNWANDQAGDKLYYNTQFYLENHFRQIVIIDWEDFLNLYVPYKGDLVNE